MHRCNIIFLDAEGGLQRLFHPLSSLFFLNDSQYLLLLMM